MERKNILYFSKVSSGWFLCVVFLLKTVAGKSENNQVQTPQHEARSWMLDNMTFLLKYETYYFFILQINYISFHFLHIFILVLFGVVAFDIYMQLWMKEDDHKVVMKVAKDLYYRLNNLL